MRANVENKSMDMEARDINFVLPRYIFQYLYESKNEDPDRIIFPMFPSVPHPTKTGVFIPIEYIPITDPAAVEIAEDGKSVPEVTPEKEAALDEKDELAKQAEEGPTVADALGHKMPEERKPKMPPGGDIGPGHPDGLGSRDARADKRIARDLKEEPAVDEDKEIPADIEKPKK